MTSSCFLDATSIPINNIEEPPKKNYYSGIFHNIISNNLVNQTSSVNQLIDCEEISCGYTLLKTVSAVRERMKYSTTVTNNIIKENQRKESIL
jgi:hypothetical protein